MNRSAFTLVELSIVLVILGLLVGGVLSGQSLIRASELRNVSKEYNGYVTALNSFRDKYFAVPGDMKNAVKFWGAADGALTDGMDDDCQAVTTAPTSTETCNGNGNGGVDGSEVFRFWQHLGSAGLIEGSYSGVPGPDDDAVLGTNTPQSRVSDSGWTVKYEGTVAETDQNFPGYYGNVLSFGGKEEGQPETYGPTLVPEEAYNIDTKLDDGLPQTGKIITFKDDGFPDCVPATNDQYLLSGTVKGCALFFLRAI